MARAATKSRKRPAVDATRSGGHRGRRKLNAAEDQLFFSKIRLHAKWMFVLLALVFAGGFVFLGVGSGSGGNGSIADLFNNLFSSSSSGTSVSSAQKKVDKNPQDATAWHDLSTAYQNKGDVPDAINALTTYTSLRPRDTDALASLAALEQTHAQSLMQDAQLAQYRSQVAYANQLFEPPTSTKLGQALATDPISQAVQSQTATAASEATATASSAYSQAVATYKKLAAKQPSNASVLLDLANAAAGANDTKTAIAALEKAKKLLPDQASQLDAQIKQLRGTPSG